MLFNSIEFTIFFPIVFSIYWFILRKHYKLQNAFILVVSYVFYGWWNWKLLSLIFISSIVDYAVGLGIHHTKNQTHKKFILALSLGTNLGCLAFFKYFNFFISSFADACSILGLNVNISSLNIILPVGISFYTFQTLSYTIDVYKGKLEPTKDIVAFLAFISFFPQLVAGPIERAANLLPQFFKERQFDYEKAKEGILQVLWGLVKKIVIADNCAKSVDYIFSHYDSLNASVLLLGVIYFAFQIYGDFSGYSDIAIGTAKLLGFDLMRNFALPYFAQDIPEFWKRWHISLSTWFRDYVYIELGGSRVSKLKRIRNVLITFTTSGLWHGANWTYVFWGFLNGLYYILFMFSKKNELMAQAGFLPSAKKFFQTILTFTLTLIAWVFFRAENIQQAFGYLAHLFDASLFSPPRIETQYIWLVTVFIAFEWLQRGKTYGLQFNNLNRFVRWPAYMLAIYILLIYGEFGHRDFIYFQF